MPHPLDGAFQRVSRAGEHLEQLKREIEAFRHHQRQLVLFDFQSRSKEDLLGDGTEVAPPLLFSILIGEVCYNLRAALDYLIYELAILDSGSPQEGTQFPIDDAEDLFKRHCERGWLD